MTIVGWIQDAELRHHGYAGTFDGLGGGVVLIGFSFLTGWFYVWLFSGRYARLAREGKPVAAKTVGEMTAWGSELFPGGGTAGFKAARGMWIGMMHVFSGCMPTLRVTVEFELNGKTERGFVALFRDDRPLRDDDGSLLLIVDEKRVWTTPSPTAVCIGGTDPNRSTLLEILEQQKESQPAPAASS